MRNFLFSAIFLFLYTVLPAFADAWTPKRELEQFSMYFSGILHSCSNDAGRSHIMNLHDKPDQLFMHMYEKFGKSSSGLSGGHVEKWLCEISNTIDNNVYSEALNDVIKSFVEEISLSNSVFGVDIALDESYPNPIKELRARAEYDQISANLYINHVSNGHHPKGKEVYLIQSIILGWNVYNTSKENSEFLLKLFNDGGADKVFQYDLSEGAATLIIKHTLSKDKQKKFFSIIGSKFNSDSIKPSTYLTIKDFEHQIKDGKQLYGTYGFCNGENFVPDPPLENLDSANAVRQRYNLPPVGLHCKDPSVLKSYP